jgi:TonB-linked SusC/RagA family outer membrane protein
MNGSLRRPSSLVALFLLVGGAAQAQAQTAVVSGRVASAQGQPLQGANVYITELNISVGTNAMGQYSLTIPAARVQGQSAVLRVRSVGFKPQERAITVSAGSQTINFALETDAMRLTELVVTGVTGATERIKVPFTVSRVDSSSMPIPGANPLNQLQGKVAGANIVSASGRPGQAPAVLLRGPRSINGADRGQEPLYIVDGIILQGSLADVDPQSIESVEVVKGAAAASLYGSRAGAGVIQIRTKRGGGSEGNRVGFRTEYGISDIEREIGIAQRHAMMMDETQTRFCILTTNCASSIDWISESMRINDNLNDFASAPSTFPIDLGSTLQGGRARTMFQSNPWPGNNYNAVQQLVKPRPILNTTLDASGRINNTNYFASASLLDQGGAISYLKGYQRQSGRVNLSQAFGDHWSADLTTYFAHSTDDGSNQEGGGAAFFRLTRTPPIVDLERTDSKGRLLVRPNLAGGGAQNENALYSLQNIERQDVTNRFLGGATVTYSPLDWLEAIGNFSYDNSDGTYKQFTNRGFRTTGPNSSTANNGSIFNGSISQRAMNSSVNVSARRALLDDLQGRFNVRALYEQRDFNQRQFNGSQLAVSDVQDGRNATQSTLSILSPVTSTRQTGFSGGVNLEYKERYIADALVRRDGSSLFGAGQRWKTYGRGSLAWIASSEPWWGFSDQVSLFKLSGSYGTAGNSPNFAAQYETFQIGTGGTLTPATLGNSDLRPEYVSELELSTEVELFSRYSFTATYAHATIDDQILLVPLAAAQGFTNQWQNAGTLDNRTWEFSLNVPVIQRQDGHLSVRLISDFLTSKISKLNVAPYYLGTSQQGTESMYRVAEGEKYGTIYGRKFLTDCAQLPGTFSAQCGAGQAFQKNSDGLIVWVGQGNTTADGITKNLWQTTLPASQAPFNVQAAWGNPIVLRDGNGGSALSSPLGQALPKSRWGLSSNMGYKRFSGYFLLDAALGQSVYNNSRHWSYLDFLSRDQDQTGRSVADAKPTSYYYRAGPPDNGAGIGGLYDVLGPNSFFVEDASYTKLREVSVAYRIGPIASKGNWTVGLVGRNLLTFTGYKGFDPEVGVGSGANNNTGFGSSALNAVDAFTFPNLRTFTFSIASTF